MAPHRIYHWKHGWIPLDHYAALSKAKGREAGARKYLAHSHATGHAHGSVVHGGYGGGTHERGLQPVSSGHLPRQGRITAAFNPTSRRFGLHDPEGLTSATGGFSLGSVTTSIPEHLAEHFHAKGYRIELASSAGGDGHHKLTVRTPSGETKVFRADGTDKEVVDAPPAPPKPPPPAKAIPATAPNAGAVAGGHRQSHTVEVRTRGPLRPGGEERSYGVIRPVGGRGQIDTIHGGLAEHLQTKGYTITGYERRVVTAVHPSGTVHRFKGDGSNLHKPVVAKPPKVDTRKIGDWSPIAVEEALTGQSGLGRVQQHKVKAAYRKGNKTVLLEHNFTDAEKTAFLGHVDQAFAVTAQHTAHDITIHVPSGDRNMRSANAYVWSGDSSRVHVNPRLVHNSAKADHSEYDPGHFKMSGRKDAHPTVATLVHELGHIVDHKHKHVKDQYNQATTDAVQIHRQAKKNGGLSGYGQTNPTEGYAEAFAHHHLNAGSGIEAHNAAAAEYAATYGWGPRPAVKAAPERQIVTKQDLTQAIFNVSSSTSETELGRIYAAAERLDAKSLLNYMRPALLRKAQAAATKRGK
jgi:hypothetical protein